MKWFGCLLLALSLRLTAFEGTVVGIHGFMLDSRSMLSIENTLECCGMDMCLWDYESKACTFCGHAQNLVEYLKSIAACKPGEPIDFVTHSTGGIILRAALNISDCPEEAKIGRAALLAPPNRGSSLARKFQDNMIVRWQMGNASGCELMTYCPEDIMALGPFPDTMEVMVIAGCRGINIFFDGRPNDKWLAVDETYLETPHIHHVYYLNHSQLLTSRDVQCLIADFFAAPRPEVVQEVEEEEEAIEEESPSQEEDPLVYEDSFLETDEEEDELIEDQPDVDNDPDDIEEE